MQFKYTSDELETQVRALIFSVADVSIGNVSDFKETYVEGRNGGSLDDREYEKIKIALADLVQRQYLSVEDFEDITNGVMMRDNKSLYEFVNALYSYLFASGSEPNVVDYMHPEYL